MSSGTLPLSTYHRAQSLGAGTYGSVITVYNDDGDEFALKLFDEDEDDDDDEVGMSLGALREISVLRLLKGANAHPNIIEIHDVQTGFDDDEVGAGTGGYLAMAMPVFSLGSLAGCISKISNKRQKISIAHGILSAVAHLHENSIIHRDIKADNILLKSSDNHGFDPVLIDFSLAKIVDPGTVIPGGEGKNLTKDVLPETESTHTPSIGTPTYRAPEVIEQKEYGLPSDLWSVGVVLLELLRGRCLEVTKDKGALKLISECLEALPEGQPFPTLIRGLLQKDPDKRLTARQALNADVFQKFGLEIDPKTFRKLNINDALPFEDDEEDDLNKENTSKKNPKGGKNQIRVDPVLAKRFKIIQKICNSMEWKDPLTAQAALSYSTQMSQLYDVDDLDESQALLDCVVLAHKFCERHLSDLCELSDTGGPRFQNWDIDEYIDSESTLFMLMDFCLYPRKFLKV